MTIIFALYIFGFRFGFTFAGGRFEWEARRILTDADAAQDVDFSAPEAQWPIFSEGVEYELPAPLPYASEEEFAAFVAWFDDVTDEQREAALDAAEYRAYRRSEPLPRRFEVVDFSVEVAEFQREIAEDQALAEVWRNERAQELAQINASYLLLAEANRIGWHA